MRSTSRSNVKLVGTCTGARSDAFECAFENRQTSKIKRTEYLLMKRHEKQNLALNNGMNTKSSGIKRMNDMSYESV